MKLYLMQHALAHTAEEDPERPLNPEGVEQVKAAARAIRKLGLRFDLIVSSPKRRARQSAALVAEAVRFPYSDLLSSDTLLPDASPGALLELLGKEELGSVLAVGHLPHLERMAGTLLQGARLQFGNAGLACLELDATPPTLSCMLSNEQLKMIR